MLKLRVPIRKWKILKNNVLGINDVYSLSGLSFFFQGLGLRCCQPQADEDEKI